MNFPKWLLVYGLVVPVAIWLGYLLATPTEFTSYSMISLFLCGLAFPLVMKWHYAALLFAWNSWIIVFFLPGQPSLGVVMAGFSFFMAILYRTMNKQARFLQASWVAYSLLFLGLVVAVTAMFTGGISGQALGGERWGAKRYLGVFGAILGYFALTAQPIEPHLATKYVALFFLGGLTAAASDIIYAAGTPFHFLFAIFPANAAYMQAVTQDTFQRFTGLSFAALSAFIYMIMRYGVTGLFEITKPWRMILFLLIVTFCMMGGYRALVIVMFMVFACQFYYEGLIRSRLFPILLMVFVLLGTLVFGFIQDLPLSVQRSLSFLPMEVDYLARQDALSTTDWRLQMWKAVLPDIPKYLLLGKGFAFSGTDFYLTQEAVKKGLYTSYEDTLIAGNYHHGILTIIIPFGIFGLLGFMWFSLVGLSVLYRNYHYGPDYLKSINTFLLAYFVARLVFYLGLYGQFDLDFYIFTGTVGLSIALNNGVRDRWNKERELEIEPVAAAQPALAA